MNFVAIFNLLRVACLALLLLDIPLSIRLCLIYMGDVLDSFPFHAYSWLTTKKLATNPQGYHTKDKIIDLIIYVGVFVYMISTFKCSIGIMLLFGSLLLRMYGVWRYVRSDKKNSDNFVWFPDLFREYSIWLALMQDNIVKATTTNYVIGFIVIAIVKTYFEYWRHHTKPESFSIMEYLL